MIYFLMITIQILFILFLIIVALFYAFSLAAGFSSAPYVSSKKRDILDMLELANLKTGIKLLELGSGKGNLCLMAAEKGVSTIGLEINPILVVWSKWKALLRGFSDNSKFYWKNFWKIQFPQDTDIVFLYLLPENMSKVWAKLKMDLKPGTLVISNSFTFPNIKPDKELRNIKLYIL